VIGSSPPSAVGAVVGAVVGALVGALVGAVVGASGGWVAGWVVGCSVRPRVLFSLSYWVLWVMSVCFLFSRPSEPRGLC
jgi:hypothetical protein